MHEGTHPHGNQPLKTRGADLSDAHAAMIMVHGRGAAADDILLLAEEFDVEGVAFLAPQAAGYTWYPYSFLMPIARNEPGLTSGLKRIGELISHVSGAGIPQKRVFLLGFSQGACLALEYAARHPGRYAGIFGLSGGLIGPRGTPRNYPGMFNRTRVFLGCSDIDSHIPIDRLNETEKVFASMGADVTKRIYPGMGHTINDDEMSFIRTALAEAVNSAT